MSWIVEFSYAGSPWERSENQYHGESLRGISFLSREEAQRVADEQQQKWEKPSYRVREVKETMRIGSYEVTEVTRDTVQVGCQTVKRSEVEEVLKRMNEQPVVKFHLERDGQPGSAWLELSGNELVLRYTGVDKFDYHLMTLTPKGFVRSSGCFNSGLPVENFAGRANAIVVSPSDCR